MNTFAKGQSVKFVIAGAHGIVRGVGIVKALVPKGASKGAARLTVIDANGDIRRPFPKQCQPVDGRKVKMPKGMKTKPVKVGRKPRAVRDTKPHKTAGMNKDFARALAHIARGMTDLGHHLAELAIVGTPLPAEAPTTNANGVPVQETPAEPKPANDVPSAPAAA
jgi:hypothetical protein